MLYRLIMTLELYQMMMMGAKAKPTLLVPARCPANRHTRMATEMPTIVPAQPRPRCACSCSKGSRLHAPRMLGTKFGGESRYFDEDESRFSRPLG